MYLYLRFIVSSLISHLIAVEMSYEVIRDVKKHVKDTSTANTTDESITSTYF